MNLDGSDMRYTKTIQSIKFKSRFIAENWDDLYNLVENDVVMNADQKALFKQRYAIEDPDARESKMRQDDYYKYMRDALYPRLRTVKFNFYLHRKGMIKDTVHTTVLDTTYMRGVAALKDMDYATALALLSPYEDFNTAVAYMGLDRNRNAMKILSKMDKTAEVNYLLSIIYSRMGNNEKAVEHYVLSCKQNRSFVYRGNLDPEISVLIKMYGLNKEDEYIEEY